MAKNEKPKISRNEEYHQWVMKQPTKSKEIRTAKIDKLLRGKPKRPA